MGSQGTSVSVCVSVGLGFRLSILSMKVKAKAKKNYAVIDNKLQFGIYKTGKFYSFLFKSKE